MLKLKLNAYILLMRAEIEKCALNVINNNLFLLLIITLSCTQIIPEGDDPIPIHIA